MNWFKKIFKSQGRVWAARAPRVQIVPLHRLTFTLADNPTPLLVNDFSLSGIGLQKTETIAHLKAGDKVKARLTIMQKTLPVGLQVVFATDQIGCKFLQAPTELHSLALEYLRFEIAAIRLSKVNAEHMVRNSGGQANWFVDDDNNELYFTKQDGRINSFYLTVLGNYVEWSESSARRFGTVLRTGDRKPYKMAASVNYAAEPAELNDLLDRFFANISQLQADDKSQLLATLK